MSSLKSEQTSRVLDERGPAIISCAEQGLPTSTICKRFGIHHSHVRGLLSKERQRRSIAGEKQLPETRPGSGISRVDAFGAVPLLTDRTLDNLASCIAETPTTAAPKSELPRRWHNTPDGLPQVGEPELPGYAAWELVHGADMSIRDTMKKLGLRYPSEVYELLASHKRGLDSRRSAALRGIL